MYRQLSERAAAMVAAHFAHLKTPDDYRVEITAGDAAMLLYIRAAEETAALDRLRANAESKGPLTSAPVVLDPQSAVMAHRLVIPYRLWTKVGGLEQLFSASGRPGCVSRAISAVRLLRGIPEALTEYPYGRGRRLKLIIGPGGLLLTVKIFPGGLYEIGLDKDPERLESAARVLLARSGIADKPRSYHRLAGPSLFYTERAVTVWDELSDNRLKSLEAGLLRQADEDRRILKGLLDPAVSLTQLTRKGG